MGVIKQLIDNITSILTTLILCILSLVTLRDVMVKFGLKPKWKLLQGWFEANYEKEILFQVLKDLGLNQSQIGEVRKKNETLYKGYTTKKIDHYEECLVALLANYTYPLLGNKEYGNETRESSQYYIHTMEMVHNEENLRRLSLIMYNLIVRDKANSKQLDFIIVPKGGNPFLAKCVSEMLKVDLLVLKGSQEESSLKISVDEDSLTYFKINFEGGNELLKKQKSHDIKKIRGIVIDCNTSGGSQVFNAITIFNKLVEKGTLKSEYIDTAYVLFRVDDGKNKFDDKLLNTKNYRLIRYFDLNEKLKKQLYELGSEKLIDYTTEENISCIKNILKQIKSPGKIKKSSKEKDGQKEEQKKEQKEEQRRTDV